MVPGEGWETGVRRRGLTVSVESGRTGRAGTQQGRQGVGKRQRGLSGSSPGHLQAFPTHSQCSEEGTKGFSRLSILLNGLERRTPKEHLRCWRGVGREGVLWASLGRRTCAKICAGEAACLWRAHLVAVGLKFLSVKRKW